MKRIYLALWVVFITVFFSGCHDFYISDILIDEDEKPSFSTIYITDSDAQFEFGPVMYGSKYYYDIDLKSESGSGLGYTNHDNEWRNHSNILIINCHRMSPNTKYTLSIDQFPDITHEFTTKGLKSENMEISSVTTASATFSWPNGAERVKFYYYADGGELLSLDGERKDGVFSATPLLLKGNTTYTCYVEVNGTQYPDTSFTTKPHRQAEAVDLGLSVKWASWNMGANSETELGGFYGYGDTTECNMSTSSYDYVRSENIFGTKYDVVRAKWGESWRMPSKEEAEELIDKCTWRKTTENGVVGYNVIGSNGNSIFIPVYEQYRLGNKPNKPINGTSYYRTGSYLFEYSYNRENSPYMFEPGFGLCGSFGAAGHYSGFPIRPVYSKDSNQ